MDQSRFDTYKKRLERERSLISAEVRQNERPVDVGSDVEDPDEETDKSEEMGDRLAVAEDLRTRLADVNAALQKFDTGKYGICERCGGPIEFEVLDADPESRFCKRCKSHA